MDLERDGVLIIDELSAYLKIPNRRSTSTRWRDQRVDQVPFDLARAKTFGALITP
jgi:hypothetical protein